MKLFKKSTIILSLLLMVVCLHISACSSGLIDEIYSKLTNDNLSERYTATIVIGELQIDEADLRKLSKIYENESEWFDRLLLEYVLAKRTQEQRYLDSFVSSYPKGKDQEKIWNLQAETGYPMGLISPLQRFLAELAKTDDQALKQLASGLPYADGAHAESLADQLAELYLYQQDRVLKTLASYPEEIKIIIAIAKERKCYE